MKTLILLFLTTLTLSANELFLYNTNEKVEISEVVANKLTVLDTTVGKTYNLTNNPSLGTTTNGSSVYMFPHRIAVLQKENSVAYFNETPIEYINNFKLSEVVKVKSSMFNFSVQGEVYCVSESTNQTIIGTTMGNVVIQNAKVFIKGGETYTHVYVIDGKVTVLDSKSSKKKKELKQGDYLVITPQIAINPKDIKISGMGNSFSVKEVEDVEKDLHLNQIQYLKNKLDNVLFVNYKNEIFGIKINSDK